jgi:hypothetical protein
MEADGGGRFQYAGGGFWMWISEADFGVKTDVGEGRISRWRQVCDAGFNILRLLQVLELQRTKQQQKDNEAQGKKN